MFCQDELAAKAGKASQVTRILSPTYYFSSHNMYMHKQQKQSSPQILPNYKNRMAYLRDKGRIKLQGLV